MNKTAIFALILMRGKISLILNPSAMICTQFSGHPVFELNN